LITPPLPTHPSCSSPAQHHKKQPQHTPPPPPPPPPPRPPPPPPPQTTPPPPPPRSLSSSPFSPFLRSLIMMSLLLPQRSRSCVIFTEWYRPLDSHAPGPFPPINQFFLLPSCPDARVSPNRYIQEDRSLPPFFSFSSFFSNAFFPLFFLERYVFSKDGPLSP